MLKSILDCRIVGEKDGCCYYILLPTTMRLSWHFGCFDVLQTSLLQPTERMFMAGTMLVQGGNVYLVDKKGALVAELYCA